MITENAVYVAQADRRSDGPKVDVRSSGGKLQAMDDPYKKAPTQRKRRSRHKVA